MVLLSAFFIAGRSAGTPEPQARGRAAAAAAEPAPPPPRGLSPRPPVRGGRGAPGGRRGARAVGRGPAGRARPSFTWSPGGPGRRARGASRPAGASRRPLGASRRCSPEARGGLARKGGSRGPARPEAGEGAGAAALRPRVSASRS